MGEDLARVGVHLLGCGDQPQQYVGIEKDVSRREAAGTSQGQGLVSHYADLFDDELDNIAVALDSLSDF